MSLNMTDSSHPVPPSPTSLLSISKFPFFAALQGKVVRGPSFMRPISPGDGYVCLLDSKRPVFRWQLAMVIQAFIHAYLEDGNELFLHCCMRMAGPWWRWRQNLTGGVSCECVCVCVCVFVYVCANHHPYPSIHRARQTDCSPTLVLHPLTQTHTHTHTHTRKHWHTTSHSPASQLVPNNLSPSLRDCLCVLWLFTVKWPLVLLMASYVVIILPPWNRQKSHCVVIFKKLTEFILPTRSMPTLK